MPGTVNDLVRLRDLLAPQLGEEATHAIMEYIPAVPASELVTRADLKAELETFGAKLEGRLIKWMAGVMLTGMAMSAGISAAVASAIAG